MCSDRTELMCVTTEQREEIYITTHSLYYYLCLDVRFHPHIYKVCPGWVVSGVCPSICWTSWDRVDALWPWSRPWWSPLSEISAESGHPHLMAFHASASGIPGLSTSLTSWAHLATDPYWYQAVWKYQSINRGTLLKMTCIQHSSLVIIA